MPRLFVAIRPPAAVRDALIDIMDFGVDGARWQDDQQLHLTLRFIGEVDDHMGEDIAAVLGDVRAASMQIALSRLGTFERRGRVDTLWVGAGPREPLTALHRKIDNALVRVGLPPERRAFRPHVTLARVGRGAMRSGDRDAWIAANAALVLPPFTADAFDLMQSTLSAGGAEYHDVARYPLAPPLTPV